MTRFRPQGVSVAIRLLPLALLATGGASLAAQSPTGKIEGHVLDASGNPIAEAQLDLVGTAFHSLTDPRGYYFFNNIPAGPTSIRAQFIGFRPMEVQHLRVLAEHTVTQDFALEAAPVELKEISVVAAYNELVPRDEVTTKQRMQGAYVDRLPVDRLTQVLALQPGVVANSRGGALSIRGGRPEETATYVDGVPVPGGETIVPTNAVEEASVTTGSTSAEFGNFQSGVISIQTRAGGTGYHGALSYETDEPFGSAHGVGLDRFEASFGGPVAKNLTFFVSGTLTGAKSSESGKGAAQYPVFIQVGLDTTVVVPAEPGEPTSDTSYVNIWQLAAYRGDCSAFSHSANPGIRSNYGLACNGIRLPASSNTSYGLQGKLSYSYGTGSRLGFTVLRSQNQRRFFSYQSLYNPQNLTGERSWSDVFTLNWTQNLTKSADRALALDTYLSYQEDRFVGGLLDPSSEPSTRYGAWLIKPLEFRWDLDNFPITQQRVTDFILDRPGVSPLDLTNTDQYSVVDQYRNNAYGLPGWAESGGPAGGLELYEENRLVGRSNLDWQVDRNNRLKAGAEINQYSISYYDAGLTCGCGDAFIEEPIRWNAYLENRLDLGDMVLVGGLRYDWYDSRASRPEFPRVTTMPGFDSSHPTALFKRDQSHGYLSPHVQVSFPVTTRTNFRLSYAHQVQSPDWGFILTGVNTGGDGADLDFGKTIQFEFGVRHAFSDDMVLDLAAYNKDNLSNTSRRSLSLPDPLYPDHNVWITRFTNADFGNTRGIDLRLDRRVGTLFNGTVGYSYQDAKNTGSDPFSNALRGTIAIGELGGSILPPPQAFTPTARSRPHTLAGQLALNFPNHWHEGTSVGAILQNVGIFAVFRLASGTAYTPCKPGLGNSAAGRCIAEGPTNSARVPMFKQFDLRVTKGFRLRGLDVTGYLDARNLFNFANVLSVFPSSNGTTDPRAHQAFWAADSATYAVEAHANDRVWQNDGSLDLGFGGLAASGCAGWQTADLRPAAPNCVYLVRAEERFGDGDHLFTIAEQRRASDAFYGLEQGLHTFTGTPRRFRIGVEVSF